jgi:hypothetical protein
LKFFRSKIDRIRIQNPEIGIKDQKLEKGSESEPLNVQNMDPLFALCNRVADPGSLKNPDLGSEFLKNKN